MSVIDELERLRYPFQTIKDTVVEAERKYGDDKGINRLCNNIIGKINAADGLVTALISGAKKAEKERRITARFSYALNSIPITAAVAEALVGWYLDDMKDNAIADGKDETNFEVGDQALTLTVWLEEV
jgi:hypothetical protein